MDTNNYRRGSAASDSKWRRFGHQITRFGRTLEYVGDKVIYSLSVIIGVALVLMFLLGPSISRVAGKAIAGSGNETAIVGTSGSGQIGTNKGIALVPYESVISYGFDSPEAPFNYGKGGIRIQHDCEGWQGDASLTIYPSDQYRDEYDPFAVRYRFREALDGSRYAERRDYVYESDESEWQHVYIERLQDGRVVGRVTSKELVENEESFRELELPSDIKFVMAVTKETLEVAKSGGRELQVITVDGDEDSLAVRADITVSPYEGTPPYDRYPELWHVTTLYYRLNGELDAYAQETMVLTPGGIELRGTYEDSSGKSVSEAQPSLLPPITCGKLD